MNKWLRDGVKEIRGEWKRHPVGCIQAGLVILLGLAMAAGFIYFLSESIPRLESGIVVDKDHEAAYTTYSTTTTRTSNSTTSTHLEPNYYPETWSICVSGYQEDGTPRTEWWRVGAGLYEAIDLGDHVQRVNGAVEVRSDERK